ncbi:MAG TPA: DUF177 domain-containing protein [Spirochaetia bacterium]|nr:DUF177 domain-containing protein [Spirochaetia bacterium]
MRIDLTEAKRTPGVVEHHVLEERMGPLELGGEDVNLPDPVRAELTVTGSEDMFWVEGRVSATGEFSCSRCLAPFRVALEAEMQEKYYPQGAPADDDVVYHHGDYLDVTREVQKALLMVLPMKPVCRTDCRGLCPTCGRDLNEGPCGCRVEAVDPRLAPLAGFFKER